MQFSPILILHICAGTLGLFSGAVAISLRKGSHRHSVAGNVFVISMLSLGASGAYLALVKHQPANFLGGIFTFYLVATAWATARRQDGHMGILSWGALLVALAVMVANLTYGLEAAHSPRGLKDGYPAGMYFFLGSVALVAAAGDLRMLVRGSIDGTQRLARHLWRMCYGLFAASASVFLARPHLFPAVLRRTGVLFVLSFLPLVLMVFWLVRVRFADRYKSAPMLRRENLRLSAMKGRAVGTIGS